MTENTATTYQLVENLADLIETITPDSIVSRTFYRGERANAVLFGFDAGQELTEHTSSHTAIVQIIQGEATITLGEDRHELGAGAWLQMPPHLSHGIQAKTPLILLLTMLK